MRLPEHGANPQRLFKALDVAPPDHIVDFSVNVNPYGMPDSIVQQWPQLIADVKDYPDPENVELKSALAMKENIHEDHLLIGNGAAEIIFLLANRFRGQDVLIVDPTFSEYRTACTAHQCRIHSLVLAEWTNWQLDLATVLPHLDGKAALFICNPNNPTGIRYEKQTLLSIIEAAHERKVAVVVDEAFYDFCLEPYTLVPYVKTHPNLAVLRSFTKMFAIAGIRLGWVAADPAFISELAARKPHWSVNAVAEKIGQLCVNEDAFVERTARRIAAERKRVLHALKQRDFVVSNSEANYYILREKNKQNLKPLLHFLMNEGLTARHTENFSGLNGNYLRFAIRTASENDRLLAALKRWRERC